MRQLLFVGCALVAASYAAAQDEFARLIRSDSSATLTAYGPRPVDLAAAKLVEEFGIDINVEDPVFFAPEDVQDLGFALPGKHTLIPKPALLELRIPLQPDGSLANANAVVRDLVDTANAMLPYAYRLNSDPFRIIPTRTRDEHGQFVNVIPVLDTHVTIPRGRDESSTTSMS